MNCRVPLSGGVRGIAGPAEPSTGRERDDGVRKSLAVDPGPRGRTSVMDSARKSLVDRSGSASCRAFERDYVGLRT